MRAAGGNLAMMRILLPAHPGRVIYALELGGSGNLIWLMKSRALFTVDSLVRAAVRIVDALARFQGAAPVQHRNP